MKIVKFWAFCVKKLWQMIGVLLIVMAILISILRYSVSYISGFNEHIQHWVRDTYGAEIYVGDLGADWHGTGPVIILKNLSFLPNELAPLDLVIAETRIKLDFWQSLAAGQLTSEYFVLNGVTATVDARSLIQGKNSGVDTPIIDDLLQLFLNQLRQFRVENSTIQFNTPDGRGQSISIDNLSWINDGNEHQGFGEFYLGDLTTHSLTFILELHGLKRQELEGQLFVEGHQLDISPWLLQLVSEKSAITASDIDFHAWATIQQGVIKQVEMEVTDSQLQWQRNASDYAVYLNSGQLVWQPTADGWTLNSSVIEFGDINQTQSPHHQQLYFNLVKHQQRYDLFISQWWLSQASELLTLFEMDSQLVEVLNQLKPQGQVTDLFLKFTNVDDWQLTGDFTQLSWLQIDNIPSMEKLAGHFGIVRDVNTVSSSEFTARPFQGWINVSAYNGQIVSQSLLNAPLSYQNLQLQLDFWLDHHQQWHIYSQELWLHNDDLDLVAEFSLLFDQDLQHGIQLAWYSEFSMADLLALDQYYPPAYLGDGTINYLNRAIQAGSLELGQLVWNGQLQGFPFTDQRGVLLSQLQVDQVDFLFAEQWPILSEVDATITFRNEALFVEPQQGYFLDIELDNRVEAILPELSTGNYLNLSLDMVEDSGKLVKLLTTTPLKEVFTPVLKELQVEGEIAVDAEIRIPLSDDDQQFADWLNYHGTATFEDNDITIVTPKIQLDSLQGVLAFDLEKIWMDGFSASWMAQPIQGSLVAQQKQHYQVHINAETDLDSQALLVSINDPLQDHLSGIIDADLEIDLNFPEQGFDYTVIVNANLDQVTATLPEPYAKKATAKTTSFTSPDPQAEDQQQHLLHLNIIGDQDSLLAHANYHDILYFNGILPYSTMQFSKAHLILGATDLGLAVDGFKVSVDLPKVAVTPWFEFIDDLLVDTGDYKGSVFTIPSLIEGKIDELTGFGHRLNGVNFELVEGNGSWDLALNAKQTRTIAHFDRDWYGKGITIKTEYLRLESGDKSQRGSLVHSDRMIAAIPPIDFSCVDCQYGKFNLQQIDIETQTQGRLLSFNKLNITKGKHVFRGKGQWLGDAGAGITSISGRFTSDDIGRLFDEYELTSSIRDSDARFDLVAQWMGGPQQFNLATLGGQIEWRMGEGHITQMSDGGSRLLSLLSFDSIIRKLKLDFRDVFSKGFFYNSIKGSMLVENGVAYTDNIVIDGIPGNLNVTGEVDLISRVIDYDSVFYPKVTSSLPVIIAWMVNPISGIAALAFDQVLESAKVVAQLRFNIQGTLDDPIVTEVDRQSRDIQLPSRVASPSQDQQQPENELEHHDKFQQTPNIDAPDLMSPSSAFEPMLIDSTLSNPKTNADQEQYQY